ncbi:MAG: GAF domain-containing protein, partial [Candidatus Schekmanbacteria bacterium]
PKKLYQGGSTFPLTKRESVSTKVMMTKKPEIKNDMQKIKHLSIYEHVKIDESKPKPIQKMITVPLLDNGNSLGVIQISRKGYTLEDAGADFTEEDAKKLQEIVPLFLSQLMKIKPPSI